MKRLITLLLFLPLFVQAQTIKNEKVHSLTLPDTRTRLIPNYPDTILPLTIQELDRLDSLISTATPSIWKIASDSFVWVKDTIQTEWVIYFNEEGFLVKKYKTPIVKAYWKNVRTSGIIISSDVREKENSTIYYIEDTEDIFGLPQAIRIDLVAYRTKTEINMFPPQKSIFD